MLIYKYKEKRIKLWLALPDSEAIGCVLPFFNDTGVIFVLLEFEMKNLFTMKPEKMLQLRSLASPVVQLLERLKQEESEFKTNLSCRSNLRPAWTTGQGHI